MKILPKPEWLKKMMFNRLKENPTKIILNNNNVHTVCKEARCPNIGECFANKTATFLLLGNKCTRQCKFCNIENNIDKMNTDYDEPYRVANAIRQMSIKFAVLTSVTRDDLSDGGAEIFIKTINEIKKINTDIKIEVLVPDFMGNKDSIREVAKSDINVFGHNLETVKNNYITVRPGADYKRSLKVLQLAKSYNEKLLIKTGIMVGLGEKFNEIIDLLKDFAEIGGQAITIGQYLAPGKNHFPVKEYIEPEIYREYIKAAKNLGIEKIHAGPFVRSSYLAEKFFFTKI